MLSKLPIRSQFLKTLPASITSSKRGFRSDILGTDIYNWRTKDELAELRAMEYVEQKPSTVKVAVTGGSGNIAYSLLFRLASGEMFGKDQRVQIHIYDIPPMVERVKGVAMELYDCAFPTCEGILVTDSLERAFDDVDVALMVGSKPRGPGQERGDLLRDNGVIFKQSAQALNKYARDCVKVTVVGNPANTNCLILANNCPDIPVGNFTAMTRLDHDRGLAQIARAARCTVSDIEGFCIWGNHSSTLFPDLANCTVRGRPVFDAIREANQGVDVQQWYEQEFIPTVQKRGAAIIDARGLSSAASAANACLMHTRDWELAQDSSWRSMAVPSDGQYGTTPGLIFSFPVVNSNEQYSVVQDLPQLDEFQERLIRETDEELRKERDAVSHLLPN